MNLVFIGLSGSGKSTFGKFVANLLNMPIIDTDEEITKKLCMPLPQIFEKYGEKFFRDLEEYETIAAANKNDIVIACGGGIVLNEHAMKALKNNGLIVYLCMNSDDILKRLDGVDDRPLLPVENRKQKIEEMMSVRNKLYLCYADIVLYPARIEESRNLIDSPLSDKLGALYIELTCALEKRVYAKKD